MDKRKKNVQGWEVWAVKRVVERLANVAYEFEHVCTIMTHDPKRDARVPCMSSNTD